jgi:hypothetical protein
MEVHMSYYDDYKKERFHDNNLISLVRYLDSNEKTSIIARGLSVNDANLGTLKDARTKRDYDVHLEFENAVICIESKVDAREDEGEGEGSYQSKRIHSKYQTAYCRHTDFRYVTYGASEYYVKRLECGDWGTGAFSRHFVHVTLNQIIWMVENSGVLNDTNYQNLKNWYRFLKYEQSKRSKYLQILTQIGQVRSLYLCDIGLTDWPNNRVNVCIPEALLFFYSRVATEWNASSHRGVLGGAYTYPVGRMGKVSDAILNFRDLRQKETLTMGGIINANNSVYFEFNDDFNLHMKVEDSAGIRSNLGQIHQFVETNSNRLSLQQKYNATSEQYQQGSHVVYEWDLRLLENVNSIPLLIKSTAEVLTNALDVTR